MKSTGQDVGLSILAVCVVAAIAFVYLQIEIESFDPQTANIYVQIPEKQVAEVDHLQKLYSEAPIMKQIA